MNLWDILPTAAAETTDLLLEAAAFRLERVVSYGNSSAEGFWYDQSEHEWVCVLQGSGVIEWQDGHSRVLRAGESLLLPAHQKHRVAATSAQPPCIWLCLFYEV